MEKWRIFLAALLAVVLAATLAATLAACGGGSSSTAVTGPTTSTPITQEPGAPALTGNTATDGYNWINYRRAQAGLATLTRNSQLDAAAQGHSDYQRLNRVITHEQTPGQPGFTGVALTNRLAAAGYALTGSYSAGEVISATTNTSGFYQAEELIAAIYHRFVIFEPVFKDIGTGAATITGSYTYFTADFAAVNSLSGLGAGRFVVYPINNQSNVPTNFFSDSESPDPVPNQNEVGYPVSVHADHGNTVVVKSFTVAPRGGMALSTRLLSAASGTSETSSAAAIVPLAPLLGATTYDVSFSGTIGGVDVTRNWSFSTK
ncbi:CAP domain-containing protein [Duganella sp. FT135W]|uniref:CAP domain-containing protein n=1 Tax=Duganella flavida TaxID=2692175 RepID=A0A6L8KLT5_9BURK|nr:CAP domain-containing protein [Duganella flavida]MYM25521.1 CAP domain-containing protein [Duganella flavida]